MADKEKENKEKKEQRMIIIIAISLIIATLIILYMILDVFFSYDFVLKVIYYIEKVLVWAFYVDNPH